MIERSLVSVIDDDESVRESLPDLLPQFGFAAQAFSPAEAFLDSQVVARTRHQSCCRERQRAPTKDARRAHRRRKFPRCRFRGIARTCVRSDQTAGPRCDVLRARAHRSFWLVRVSDLAPFL